MAELSPGLTPDADSKRSAPFQVIRIHRLLGSFVLGHLLILPILTVAVLVWLCLGDPLSEDAGLSLLFSAYGLLAYGWLIWLIRRRLRREGIPLTTFAGPPPRMGLLPFWGWVLMLVASSFGLLLPNDLLLLAQHRPLENGLMELWPDGDLAANLYNAFELIGAVIAAPWAEELLFRGIFLHRLTVKWNLREAIVISSLIFGLLHGFNPGAVVFGLLMSLIYLESGSLRLTICCHSLHNGLIYLLSWLEACRVLAFKAEALIFALDALCLILSLFTLGYWFQAHRSAWQIYPPFLRINCQPDPAAQKSRQNCPG